MDFKKETGKLKEMYINGTFDKCEYFIRSNLKNGWNCISIKQLKDHKNLKSRNN